MTKVLCGRCGMEVVDHVPWPYRVSGRECLCVVTQQSRARWDTAIKDGGYRAVRGELLELSGSLDEDDAEF